MIPARDAKKKEHDDKANCADDCVGPAEEEVLSTDPGRGRENEEFSTAKSVDWVVVVRQQLVSTGWKV